VDSADGQKRDFEPVDGAERSIEIATPSQKGQKNTAHGRISLTRAGIAAGNRDRVSSSFTMAARPERKVVMKKTLTLLVCLLLLIGSAGVALAGNGSPAPTRDGAVEWVLDWLDSLVDQARDALPGSAPAADSQPSQPAASSTESGADGADEDVPGLGPLIEPAG
jgi:hypothetical protein